MKQIRRYFCALVMAWGRCISLDFTSSTTSTFSISSILFSCLCMSGFGWHFEVNGLMAILMFVVCYICRNNILLRFLSAWVEMIICPYLHTKQTFLAVRKPVHQHIIIEPIILRQLNNFLKTKSHNRLSHVLL